MIALALPGLPGVLGIAYGLVGVGVAVAVQLKTPDVTAAIGALVAWPVYLPLLFSDSQPTGRGPYAERIGAVFGALESTLTDPAAGEVPWDADFTGLQAALRRTDERLALVDRLLRETGDAPSLSTARDRTAAEVEAVLAEVMQLRVQIGLAALAGNTACVRDRLGELLHRARALDEVEGMQEVREHG